MGGGILATLSLLHAALLAYVGRCIALRRHRRFCLMFSVFDLTYIPLGTTLSVFALLLLLKPQVRQEFAIRNAACSTSTTDHSPLTTHLSSMPHILMCPPDHFGIEYEINPWMSRSRQSDQPFAPGSSGRPCGRRSRRPGAKVELLDPVAGLPDLVFTANAAMIYRGTAVLARFRHRGAARRRAARRGLVCGARLRGPAGRPRASSSKGPATPCSAATRSSPATASAATPAATSRSARCWACRVIPLELVNDYYYHLDTCFCPLAPGVAIYYPRAFDDYAQLRAQGARAGADRRGRGGSRSGSPATPSSSAATVVTNTGCPKLHDDLRARGFEPRETLPRRVRQSRRQRQVPDAPPGRRRSRELAGHCMNTVLSGRKMR